jgi:predicted Zn-ribbon and HTH transcriptional regulator
MWSDDVPLEVQLTRHREQWEALVQTLTAQNAALRTEMTVLRAERDEARYALATVLDAGLSAPRTEVVAKPWPCPRCGKTFERIGGQRVCNDCKSARERRGAVAQRARNQQRREGD